MNSLLPQIGPQALSIQDLRISFGNSDSPNEVVHGINLSVAKGECLGIVGESGSGKSISCLASMQLLPKKGRVSTGKVLFNDGDEIIDLLSLKESRMRTYRGSQLAMIFQEPLSSFNPSMRCGKQVDEMIRIHNNWNKAERKTKILSLFEQVELPEPERIYSSYPHELSGGQLQRIMIAMAISCNPDILIADEPTTALDVTVQKGILELIARLKHEMNMSILFISHDLGVISEIADKVVVMQNGIIVESGTKDEVLKTPKNVYTKGLLACLPNFQSKLKHLPVFDSKTETVIQAEYWSNEKHKERKESILQAQTILSVKNLNVTYSGKSSIFSGKTTSVHAVKDVSFNLKHGETIGIVGESGSGKSSLIKAIIQLEKANSGQVEFLGSRIEDLSEKQLRPYRKEMQMIFQDPYSSLNPRMRIGRAIQEPMEVHGLLSSSAARKKRSLELLDLVGLDKSHYDRYPHEFSGGQRQRICIARAISSEPKLILCDECVSALDVSVQAQVLNLLVDIQEKLGISYVFISHDLSVVHFISDRIAVMKEGAIVEMAEKDEIFQNPQTAYTRSLLNSIPKRDFNNQ